MKMYISDYLNDFVRNFNSFEEDWDLYDGIEDKDCYKYEFRRSFTLCTGVITWTIKYYIFLF